MMPGLASLRSLLLILLLFAAFTVRAQQPDFTIYSPSNPCIGQAYFQFTPVGGPYTAFKWTCPALWASPNTNQAPSGICNQVGTHQITLEVSTASGLKTVTKSFTVYDTPKVNFTVAPTTICPGGTVNLNSTSILGTPGPAQSYQWVTTGGDPGGSTAGPTTSVKYYATGTYSVTLIVKNSQGCVSSHTKNAVITVLPKPNASFSTPQTIFCSAPTPGITFTALPNVATYTYAWSFPGGNPATGNGVSVSGVTYNGPAPNAYDVKLVVTDGNGCTDTVFVPDYIEIKKHTGNFTVSPTSACLNTPITFTNTSTTNITSSSWNFGAGASPASGTGSPVTATYSTPGTKTITLTSHDGPCSAIVTKQVVIHPKPTVNFTMNPTKYTCNGTVTFVPTGNASTFQWNFGDGAPLPAIHSTATSPTHTYTTCGLYAPTLIGTSSFGCTDTITKTDSVQFYCGWVEAWPSKDKGCIPLQVSFVSEAWGSLVNPLCPKCTYPVPITAWEWKFWDKNPAVTKTGATPSYQFDSCGVHKVTLKATMANGCIFYDTVEIKAGDVPIADYSIPPYTAGDTIRVCPDDVVYYQNETKFPCFKGGDTTFKWQIGPVITVIRDPYVKFDDTAGTFCAILKADYNGCVDFADTIFCVVVDSPVAKFDIKYNCDTPLKVKFINLAYGYDQFHWDFGPLGIKTDLDPVVTFPTYGSHNVKLVTHNDSSGCWDSIEKTVTLMKPTPVLLVDDSTICLDEDARFTAYLTNPAFSTSAYKWYINGNLVADSMLNFTDTFNLTGYYDISVVMQDAMGCPQTAVKNDWLLVSKPDADFTATTPGCEPFTANFTDLSVPVPSPGAPIITRLWDFDNGTASYTVGTASRLYPNKGVYDIGLIVTDASGCKDTITKPEYIKVHKPVADFEVDDTTACGGQELTFTNLTPTVYSAVWDFGDGSPQVSAIDTTHVYQLPGTYTVTMIATDTVGCKDTMVKTNYIKLTRPDAKFTIRHPQGICTPFIDTFDNLATGLGPFSYYWDFGNGDVSASPSGFVSSVYTDPKKYTVMFVVKDKYGCPDTAIDYVTIVGYAGSFSYTPLSGCVPLQVNFTANVTNIPSVIWDFNDGNSYIASGTGPVSHTYTIPGAYVPKVIFSNGAGCAATSVATDTIKVDAAVAALSHSPACEGHTVTFTDSSWGYFSTITSRLWMFHDGTISPLDKVNRYFPTTGTYPIRLAVVNANGCRDTLDEDFVIHPRPVISAGADTTICLHDSAQLQATGGISYLWVPDSALSCADCPNPFASPQGKVTYYVIGSDVNRCSDTDDVLVTIKLKVESEVGPDGEICEDESTTLEASGATTYEWTPAESLNDNKSPTPVASPHNTTLYTVVAYQGSCIPDTGFVKIEVHPKPEIKASGGTTIIAGKETPLHAEGKNIKYFLWTPNGTLSCDDCPGPLAKPVRTTIYTVIATTAEGCSDSDKVTINVLCDKSQLYIPNTFTPNGDGENDIFYPRGVGLDVVKFFRVYNRWGEVVYERRNFQLNDKTAGWDGNYKGEILAPDVFVYIIEADCENQETIQWKGDVTLIR